jgi:amino acid adenylation domain-containing protein
MKLSEMSLVGGRVLADLMSACRRWNESGSGPVDTVHHQFALCAAGRPDAAAAEDATGTLTYRQLDAASNRVARLLIDRGLRREEIVAVICADTAALLTGLLGALKAGGAYCPIDPAWPSQRVELVLNDVNARFVLFDRACVRMANRMQWQCESLETVVCLDSAQVEGEIEQTGEKMRVELWDHVGQQAFDAISAGGWKSSYTGEWLSAAVMDEYARNAETKLAPLLDRRTRVLEVGCGSGLTLARVAPRVGRYCATDLSSEVLAWAQSVARERQLDNVRFANVPAHAVDGVDMGPFDVVIINSVIQCFSGHNYLRDVIRKVVDLVDETGWIFLGNLFDEQLRKDFLESLRQHRALDSQALTKTDFSEELFVHRDFLSDLQHDFPAIASIATSGLIASEDSELSRFTFDALMRLDKRQGASQPIRPRVKKQVDLRVIGSCPATPIEERSSPESSAYVMYTSGSSGVPKGVVVPHRAIGRLVVNSNYATLSAADRILMTGSVAFDASTFEIWGALLNGGTLVRPPGTTRLDPKEMARWIDRYSITTMWLTARLFDSYVEADVAMFAGLRQLLVGGERLSVPHVNRVRTAHPGLIVVNGYGPTENTTFTSCHVVERSDHSEIPIGRPVPGTSVWILDGEMRPVPIGVHGEVFAGGQGLARGYLNDPSLTATRFVPNPFDHGTRLYRTGDRGRWTADGTIEFCGRVDEQVKFHGYRIEPGEIEARIREQPGVRQAVVCLRRTAALDAALVAYVTGSVTGDAITSALRRELPEPMVPAFCVVLDQLPLTGTGKIDLRALPDPILSSASTPHRVTTEGEKAIAAAWHEVLGRYDISVHDDFFRLGGDSIGLIRVLGKLRASGWDAEIHDLFRHHTVAGLATALRPVGKKGETPPVGAVRQLRVQTAPGAAWETETEAVVAQCCQELPAADALSPSDRLVDVDGRRLEVAALVAAIRQRLNVDIPVAAVHGSPTVRRLADAIIDAARTGTALADETMVLLGGDAAAPAVFALPPGTGDVLSYIPLASRWPDLRVYAFNFIEPADRLTRYADLIEATQPDGSCVLLGYSGGGNLAFHLAAELERRRRRVASIVMIDSARILEPYPFLERQIRKTAADFLAHPAIRLYCATPALRDQVTRRILTYYRLLSCTRDTHTVAADIHVLLSAGGQMEGTDGGQSMTAWSSATRGRFGLHQGEGAHNQMLLEPAVAANAGLLRSMLDGAFSAGPVAGG